MQEFPLPPTTADVVVAKAAARYTNPPIQKLARTITWAADGKVLCALSAVFWVLSRGGSEREHVIADHLLVTTLVATAVPHLIKSAVHQKRPDRSVVARDRRGVRTSGKPHDAFPSGHGVHIGAVASALSWANPEKSGLVWALGGAIAATRVAVLAHWVSDVVAGLIIGVGVERTLRRHARPPDNAASYLCTSAGEHGLEPNEHVGRSSGP
jgi:membrane-associated phospholipid phosphatase